MIEWTSCRLALISLLFASLLRHWICICICAFIIVFSFSSELIFVFVFVLLFVFVLNRAWDEHRLAIQPLLNFRHWFCIHICIYICIHICLYVCVYICIQPTFLKHCNSSVILPPNSATELSTCALSHQWIQSMYLIVEVQNVLHGVSHCNTLHNNCIQMYVFACSLFLFLPIWPNHRCHFPMMTSTFRLSWKSDEGLREAFGQSRSLCYYFKHTLCLSCWGRAWGHILLWGPSLAGGPSAEPRPHWSIETIASFPNHWKPLKALVARSKTIGKTIDGNCQTAHCV